MLLIGPGSEQIIALFAWLSSCSGVNKCYARWYVKCKGALIYDRRTYDMPARCHTHTPMAFHCQQTILLGAIAHSLPPSLLPLVVF